tara:strand:- start:94 stop:390 length:297 start_codon:yes stop_codon:yes gene_type:complete
MEKSKFYLPAEGLDAPEFEGYYDPNRVDNQARCPYFTEGVFKQIQKYYLKFDDIDIQRDIVPHLKDMETCKSNLHKSCDGQLYEIGNGILQWGCIADD